MRRFRARREPAAQEDSDGAGFEEDPGYTEAFLRCRCGPKRAGLLGVFLGCGAEYLRNMRRLVTGRCAIKLACSLRVVFSVLFSSEHMCATLGTFSERLVLASTRLKELAAPENNAVDVFIICCGVLLCTSGSPQCVARTSELAAAIKPTNQRAAIMHCGSSLD